MKLASVQKITDIQPIEGADSIEVASVLGWKVVVKKGEYNIGDLCGYIQIDTVVPDSVEFEFLRERKFRVRTIKLRGQISQGLIVPVPSANLKEGDDITAILGVKKFEKVDNNPSVYEKPRMPKKWHKKYIYLFKYNFLYKLIPSLVPKTRSPFPTNLVPITDEERIQNMPKVIDDYKGNTFYLSHKLDGSSITIIHNKFLGKSKFRICSRRFELHDSKNDWYKVFKQTQFDQEIIKLVKHFKTNDIIVQGEAVGKFNGNHHALNNEQIRLFSIYVNGERLNPMEFNNVCTSWNIPFCPLYKKVEMNHSLEDILKISDIPDVLNPRVPAEGLVWRSEDGKLSFKAINNKYLLKKGE